MHFLGQWPTKPTCISSLRQVGIEAKSAQAQAGAPDPLPIREDKAQMGLTRKTCLTHVSFD
jgi:hypothetical protein